MMVGHSPNTKHASWCGYAKVGPFSSASIATQILPKHQRGILLWAGGLNNLPRSLLALITL